jgi:hypothetical protein
MPKRQMLFNVGHHLIREYRQNVDKSESITLAFMINKRREIVKYFGFGTFKEMTLNYRMRYNRKNSKKLIHDYVTYVLTKTTYHKSDLAISYNMIKYIGVPEELAEKIIDFMYCVVREKDLNPTLEKFETQRYFLKKHMMMDYVDKDILTTRPR